MEILHTVVTKKVVNSAKNLIKAFEPLQKEAKEQACKDGFCLNQLKWDHHIDWRELNEEGTKVLLQFKLDIYSNN